MSITSHRSHVSSEIEIDNNDITIVKNETDNDLTMNDEDIFDSK